MARLSSLQSRELFEALERFDSAGDVWLETGLPWRQVVHLQRLYGAPTVQHSRRKEDQRSGLRLAPPRKRRSDAS